MKTLHLTNSWHASSGGVGAFYKALFQAAERRRQRMVLVAPGSNTGILEVGAFGRIYEIEAPRAPLNPDYRLVLPHRFLFPRTALRKILNAEQPDLVEVSDKYSMNYLAGLLRTRRLPEVHFRPTAIGMSHERMDENMAVYLSRSGFAQSFCRWYMKWIYFPMFDHHITVSEHTAAELIVASRGHKVRRGIWVAPMGVDCERFTPEKKSEAARRELRDRTGGAADSRILLYAGRLAPEKNLPLLIESAALLDPARYRLAVAGGGILREELQRECAERGLDHVAFLGHIANRDTLAKYLANADAFVHPNPREPFGIAPLEAMAAGLALVAPDQGGVTSYANPANSWPAAPRPREFAQAIRAASDQSPERDRRVAAARETAREHSWERVTDRYLQLYREIHAATRGMEESQSISARIYSTPGDCLGREFIGS